MNYDTFDTAALEMLQRVGGDSLITRMFDAFRASAAVMTAGLAEAKRSGDRETIVRYAHSLQSTAGQLGLVRLREAAQRIEAELSNDGELSTAAGSDELAREIEMALTWLGSSTPKSI